MNYYYCGNLRCVGLLGNVLGRPRHALQRLRHALQRPRCLQRPRRPRHAFLQGPKSPTSKKPPPPTLLPYKL